MKQYIKLIAGFYRTNRETLLKSYQKNVLDKGQDKLPFELYVIALCEDKHQEELYDWVLDNWTTLAKKYIEEGFMKPSVRESYGIKTDLFFYILMNYSKSNLK